MSTHSTRKIPSALAPDLSPPRPDALYSLDEAAHLAGVPRRSLLIYCRAGLVRPVLQPPYGMLAFTEDAIHIVRQAEYVRSVHVTDVAWLKAMFELLEEVEYLRAEVRFLRDQ
jgi:hypothetical protein